MSRWNFTHLHFNNRNHRNSSLRSFGEHDAIIVCGEPTGNTGGLEWMSRKAIEQCAKLSGDDGFGVR
jgi:hypothetical protein